MVRPGRVHEPTRVLAALSHVNMGVVPSEAGSAKVAMVKLAWLAAANATYP